MKHLFLYFGPLYFVYLLRTYCWQQLKRGEPEVFSMKRFLSLSFAVISVFAISFLPFRNHLPQILSRLVNSYITQHDSLTLTAYFPLEGV
jgi:alpha-1,3-glucosyltransferase